MKKVFLPLLTVLACSVAAAGLCPAAAAQDEPVTYPAPVGAVVEFSRLAVRAAADYEAPLETEYLMGAVLSVSGEDRYWRSVTGRNPDYEGWSEELGLAFMTEDELAAYQAAPKYICTAETSHIYSEPSTGSRYLTDFLLGDIVRKGLSWNGKPYAKGRFFQVVLPSGRIGYVLKSDVADLARWQSTRPATPQATVEAVIAAASRFLGRPYVWGGTSILGVDCSGLTWNAFHLCGIELPRNTSGQVRCGDEVAPEDIRRGDLIFFGRPATPERGEGVSHVAIYLGDGRILHASQQVRISSLREEDPDFYEHRPILHIRRLTED